MEKTKKKIWTNVNYYLMIYNELFSPGRLQWLHEKLHDRRLCQGINQETLIYVQYNLKTNVQYSKCGIQEPSMHHHVPDSKNWLLLFYYYLYYNVSCWISWICIWPRTRHSTLPIRCQSAKGIVQSSVKLSPMACHLTHLSLE